MFADKFSQDKEGFGEDKEVISGQMEFIKEDLQGELEAIKAEFRGETEKMCGEIKNLQNEVASINQLLNTKLDLIINNMR